MDGCKVQDVHQITKLDISIIYKIKFLEYGIPITQGYLLENVHFLYFLLFFLCQMLNQIITFGCTLISLFFLFICSSLFMTI